MPDLITPEERAMIENAIAQGKVTVIPEGVRAMHHADYKWCEKTRRLAVTEEGRAKPQQVDSFHAGRAQLNGNRAKAAEFRKEALIGLLKDGKTKTEAAAVLKINPRTVNKLIKELKDAGRYPSD